MSGTSAPATTIHAARRPKQRWGWLRPVAIVVVLVAALAGGSLWALGYRPGRGYSSAENSYATVEISRGEVRVIVLESGSLESADNAMIKCQVEALLGTIGTAQPGINGQGGGGRGMGGGPDRPSGSRSGSTCGGGRASRGRGGPGRLRACGPGRCRDVLGWRGSRSGGRR